MNLGSDTKVDVEFEGEKPDRRIARAAARPGRGAHGQIAWFGYLRRKDRNEIERIV